MCNFNLPVTSPFDGGPLPNTFVADTLIVIAVVGGQKDDVKILNM